MDYDKFTLRKRLRELTSLSRAMIRGALVKPRKPQQRLIFTSTNGRSGSDMLHTLFGGFHDLTTTHEPEPDFRHLRPFAAESKVLAKNWLKYVKLPAIAELPGSIYVETSHMFCKGYVEPMVALGQAFDLIVLVRPARQIALSMCRLPAVPGSGPWARCFYVSPGEPNLLPLKDTSKLSDYQICYWHALENERRQEKYRRVVLERGGRVAQIETADLCNGVAVVAMFEALALDLSQLDFGVLEERLQKRVNIKAHEKKDIEFDDTRIEREEAQVRELTGLANKPASNQA